MLQAIGLTSARRRDLPPAVDDLTFEARSGRVTALLGVSGAGKTAALRLMLELDPGRGVTYFRGRPLHRIGHPPREVGVLLGDVPGHPARTARGQLRMLCAAAGAPLSRADEMLDVVGLSGLGDQRIGGLSVGMDRRLGLAAALLGDPHTLLLDDPTDGLSSRESAWLYGLMRAHAAQGGTVLWTTGDPKEAIRSADRVVTIDGGRLVADQEVADFARTRLRPRVVVQSPHAARLAAVVGREARDARRSVEIVAEEGTRLSVYGSNCAEIGDTAFRYDIPLHRLADELGDAGPPAPPAPAPASAAALSELPPPITVRPPRGPLRPMRYEVRRMLGVTTTPLIMAVVVIASAATSVLMARTGGVSQSHLLGGWPVLLPLPPAALGAGLLGALSYGDEFRYPALAASRGTVPRRLGLLVAKLLVTGAAATVLSLLVALCDLQLLRLFYGEGAAAIPGNATLLAVSWVALAVGCTWAGLLAAGTFRVAGAGVAAVLAVPVLVVPLLQKAFAGPAAHALTGLPARLRGLAWLDIPPGPDRWLLAVGRILAQPVGLALLVSLAALICAYVGTALRNRARW
ncbi:ATP-binding cassette domain-containing protein [Streptomyces sp. NPDC005576]|uniref:ATP-binding cassette domain-containing protein n=1 Tax=Streptomyces sp. NPDC005576 TaxID=3364726 RepID=UPI0036CE3C98